MELAYKRVLEVKYESDVIVVGGGPAGVAAAVMCARQGASVLLLEQTGSLGGSSMQAMVPELMNFDDGEHFLCGGIGKEIFDELFEQCRYNREWYNVKSEKLKLVYDKLANQAGVRILFYVRLCDVIVDGGNAKYIVVSGAEGMWSAKAKVFIDCTGNGSLCVMAGAEYEYGDDAGKTMPATICTLWGGVDFNRKSRDDIHYQKAYDDGLFSQFDPVLPGIKSNYRQIGIGGGNAGHCFGVDDRDSESLTAAMLEGRRILSEYEQYYRNYVEGCEQAELVRSADFIGIRESRRIKCEYMLTTEHFFEKNGFPDEIGRYSYPVDIHPMRPDAEEVKEFRENVSIRHKKGESYSIPYRALIPKGLDNVLVAGRCMGADRAMQASIRVIPCCYITGQAAGIAAAVCVMDNTPVNKADTSKIRDILRANGAFIRGC